MGAPPQRLRTLDPPYNSLPSGGLEHATFVWPQRHLRPEWNTLQRLCAPTEGLRTR